MSEAPLFSFWSTWRSTVPLALTLVCAAPVWQRCSEPTNDQSHTGHPHKSEWTCSMDPHVRRSSPGRCPVCGMDLIEDSETRVPTDTASTRLSRAAVTRARIETDPVQFSVLPSRQIRLFGRIDLDPGRVTVETARVSGWVSTLAVSDVGQSVSRGQLVANIYSPEIYDAHYELLTALDAVKQAEADGNSSRSAKSSLTNTRNWFLRHGITAENVRRFERIKKPTRFVGARATATGVVLKRIVSRGHYVRRGSPLLEIADLSRVWVRMDIRRSDLAFVREGQSVEIIGEDEDHPTTQAQIDFVSPVVEPASQTIEVRATLPNPHHRWRPGTYVTAIVHAPSAETQLVIPSSAPLFAGPHAVVYVASGDEPDHVEFTLRRVRLGRQAGGLYPVLEGLAEGERIVRSGAFFIDADVQLKARRSMVSTVERATSVLSSPPRNPASQPAAHPTSRPRQKEAMPSPANRPSTRPSSRPSSAPPSRAATRSASPIAAGIGVTPTPAASPTSEAPARNAKATANDEGDRRAAAID